MCSLKRYAALVIAMAGMISGCMSVATSGAQAIYNHKSLQENAHDQYVTVRAYQALDSDQFKKANIGISTLNRVVLLTGEVSQAWQKKEAERLVRRIAGVDDVYNWIKVEEPASQFDHLNDSWLTAKVKTKLIASADLDATKIKVITEKGTVYLMGFLKPDEAEEAAQTASHTDGVQKVVKIFSYIKISKTPV